MKKHFSILFLVAIVVTGVAFLGFSPDGDRTPRTKQSFDNPKVVYGPQLGDNPQPISESFEAVGFPPAGWTKLNPDGGTGWDRQTVGTTPIPGWNGGVITTPPGGLTAVAFCTWNTGGAVSNDQWLVTPQITNVGAGDSLSFWIQCPGYTNGSYLDYVYIMVSTTTPTTGAFSPVDTLFWPAASPDTNWTRYAYKLTDLAGVTAGSNIYVAWREKVADNFNDGAAILLDLVDVTVLTAIQQTSNQTPDAYRLSQNYPNPFNPSTSINFDIAAKGFVSLKVYDMLGREVANLVNKELTAGSYSYNFDASKLNSGIYFYKLQTGSFVETKKMMLVK
ncbi:MAG: choice-of-anchor J domain-containing protein [Ignavibacteriae bacterium]|nr:choice-of-anchor J domain-containing protein [Ignavibacteriota bacterium]MCB9244623.1 choice-of-anchor J domain-containing protein [Ignavibacteriales bacterium]